MKDNNLILAKSEDFAVRIIKLYRHLYENLSEKVLSKQLLRSGTSIGANINEAICGISKRDFLAKMHIAFKECNETRYWLRLLHRTGYLSDAEYNSIEKDCADIYYILNNITKTTSQTI